MDDSPAQKTPSQRIIEAFGGIRATGRRFDKAATTVQHWYDHGIPAKHQQMFIGAETEEGRIIGPEDFFDAPSDEAAAPSENRERIAS